MDTWNKRMARALAESEFTPNAFATAMGVAAPTVSAWIGAATITPTQHIKAELMLRACELLKIRPQWLILKQGPMRGPEQVQLSDEMRKIMDALAEIDQEGGERRDDAIYFINRLLRPEDKGARKSA
jgi:hypothetical protein